MTDKDIEGQIRAIILEAIHVGVLSDGYRRQLLVDARSEELVERAKALIEEASDTTEIDSCPFCGGKAVLVETVEIDGECHYGIAYVRCTQCGARGKKVQTEEYYGPPDGTPEDAVKAWNRRAD